MIDSVLYPALAMRRSHGFLALVVTLACVTGRVTLAVDPSSAHPETVDFGRFQQCPLIENRTEAGLVRVVLCPQYGGRILEYSLGGINALFVSDGDLGTPAEGSRWRKDPSAGRFDIGPEMMMPRRDALFRGEWTSERIGPLHVRMTSPDCPATRVRLVRDFKLSGADSHLSVKQTVINLADQDQRYCHWSRTLANGAGIVVMPLTYPQRFPSGYVRYDSGSITMKPEDPNVRVREGYLELLGPPLSPKLGMDTMAGWLAHQQPSGLLFVKKFATYPDRPYAEIAGLTVSTWTPPTGETVELEPIGPSETIAPGSSFSFVEHWWLLDSRYPDPGEMIDLSALSGRVESLGE